jgi:hypothetical protein
MHRARPKVAAIITLCLRFRLCVVGPFFCGEPSLAHGKGIVVHPDILRLAKICLMCRFLPTGFAER